MLIRMDDSFAASRASIICGTDEGHVLELAKEPPKLVGDAAEHAIPAGVSGFGGFRSGGIRGWWRGKDPVRVSKTLRLAYNDCGR